MLKAKRLALAIGCRRVKLQDYANCICFYLFASGKKTALKLKLGRKIMFQEVEE